MELRYITEEDIITAQKWTEDWGKTPIDFDMYPTTGLVLEDEGEGVWMGFVWFPKSSKMAQIGFITRNRHYSKGSVAKQHLKNFIQELTLYCYNEGYRYVITWGEATSIVKAFKELGFTESSNNVSELIVKLA